MALSSWQRLVCGLATGTVGLAITGVSLMATTCLRSHGVYAHSDALPGIMFMSNVSPSFREIYINDSILGCKQGAMIAGLMVSAAGLILIDFSWAD